MEGLSQRPLKALTFVTGNANKLRELSQVLGPLMSVRNEAIDLPEMQGSVEFIVGQKVMEACRRLDGPALVEDTCLEFEALGGMPGPYIKV